MRKERDGIWRELWNIVKKQIGYALGVSALIAVTTALLLAFYFDNLLTAYTLQFFCPYFSCAETLDGKPFIYGGLTSEEFLQTVKESDGRFAEIDLEDGKITIGETDFGYALTARGIFPNAEIAEAFLRTIVSLACEQVQTAAEKLSFRFDFSAYENADYSD